MTSTIRASSKTPPRRAKRSSRLARLPSFLVTAAALVMAGTDCTVEPLLGANIADQSVPGNPTFPTGAPIADPSSGSLVVSDALNSATGIWEVLTTPNNAAFLSQNATLQIGGNLTGTCPTVAQLNGADGFDSCLVVGFGTAPSQPPQYPFGLGVGLASFPGQQIEIPLSFAAVLAGSQGNEAQFAQMLQGTVWTVAWDGAPPSFAAHMLADVPGGCDAFGGCIPFGIQPGAGMFFNLRVTPQNGTAIQQTTTCSASNSASSPSCGLPLIIEDSAFDIITLGCDQVTTGVSVRGMTFSLGFVPTPWTTLPTARDLICSDPWTWTQSFGTSPLHLPWEFNLQPVVAGLPKWQATHDSSDLDDRQDFVGLFSFPTSALSDILNPVGALACLAIQETAEPNFARLASFSIYNAIGGLLQQAATGAAPGGALLASGAPPAACNADPAQVAACTVTPGGSGCSSVCSEPHAVSWLGSSMTAVALSWFASPFGEYSAGAGAMPGWLPICDVNALSSPPPVLPFPGLTPAMMCTGSIQQSPLQVGAVIGSNTPGCDLTGDFTTPVPCDGVSETITFNFNLDPDRDGLITTLDPTPFCPGSNLIDLDGDGIPDDCETCPGTPGVPAGPLWDVDGDGICNKNDNCVWVSNVDQANCNSVAEQVLHLKPLGDACDPEICPGFTWIEDYTYNGGDLGSTCESPAEAAFALTPLAEHSQQRCEGTPLSPTTVTTTTTAWFCEASQTLNFPCDDPSVINTFGPLVENYPWTAGITDSQGNPWHPISIVGSARGADIPLTYAASPAIGSTPASPPSAKWVWDFSADEAFWVAQGIIAQPPTVFPGVAGGGMKGTVCLHAENQPGAVGLPNHYLPFSPNGNDCNLRPAGSLGNCNGPPCWGLDLGWLNAVDPDPNSFVRWDAALGEASLVVLTTAGQFVAPDRTGGGQVITNLVGPALQAQASNPSVVWVEAAEPVVEMGAGPQFPMALALSSDGTQVVDTVVSATGSLLAEQDRGVVRGPLLTTPPPAQQGFVSVLSRIQQRVYEIGGAGGIWTAAIDGANQWQWALLTASQFAVVDAATYHWPTSALVVLEAGDALSLVAVDASTGVPTLLGRSVFTHGNHWDHSWLTTDLQGNVLLSQSSVGANVHRITRIAVSPGVALGSTGTVPEFVGTPIDSFVGPYPLIRAPLVDRTGISRFVLGAGGVPSLLRSQTLPGMPVGWSDLAGTPTLTPLATLTSSCSNSSVQFPAPTITSATPQSISGAITSANGQPLSPPISLSNLAPATAGTFVGTGVPSGLLLVTWTVVDALGYRAQTVQAFEVNTPGPCFGGIGPQGWTANPGGPLTPGVAPGGGPGSALEVQTPIGWNVLLSPTFSTNGLVIGGSNLEFDLYLPPNLAGQYWWGQVEVLISIPSANIYHQWLGGNMNLIGSNLPLGQFSTIVTPLPANVLTALSGSHNDVTVEIDLNSPVNQPPFGPWFLQNFRFGN